MDWQEKSERAMAELQESYDSPTFQKLIEWVTCQYEAEKEALVVSSMEQLPEHFMKVKALREFRLMLVERQID